MVLRVPKSSPIFLNKTDSFNRVVTPLSAFNVTSKGIVKYLITPPIDAAIPPVIAPNANPNITNGVKNPPSPSVFSLPFSISLICHFLKILKMPPRVLVCFFSSSSWSSSVSELKNENIFLNVPVVISLIPIANDFISFNMEFNAEPIISVVLLWIVPDILENPFLNSSGTSEILFQVFREALDTAAPIPATNCLKLNGKVVVVFISWRTESLKVGCSFAIYSPNKKVLKMFETLLRLYWIHWIKSKWVIIIY